MGIDALSENRAAARRAVFLDRDGVLNRVELRNGRPHPPASLAALEILPRVDEALRLLRDAGYLRIVVTNQPDVARGTSSKAEVDAINDVLMQRLPLDWFEVCFHDDVARCACRKPEPGLILESARRFGVDPAASFMVGDRWRDIEAGHRARCRTILVGDGYGETFRARPEVTVASLYEATQWIWARAAAD